MEEKNNTWSSYEFLRNLGIALSIISIGIAIAIVGYVLAASKSKSSSQPDKSTVSPTLTPPS